MQKNLIAVMTCGALCLQTACADLGPKSGIRFDATSPIKNPPTSSHVLGSDTDMDHQVDLVPFLMSEIQQRDPAALSHLRISYTDPTRVGQTSGDSGVIYLGTDNSRYDNLIAVINASPASKAIRDDVVAALVQASTSNCRAYVKSLRGGQVGSRLVFDFLSGGLATAGSLSLPAQSAKILGGLSALSTAEGSSVDRNVFAQQAAEAIGGAILKLTAQDLERIDAKSAQTYQQWPLQRAMADVMAMHGDCSVTRGLVQMQNALQQRETAVLAVRAAAANVNPANAPALLKVITSIEDPTPFSDQSGGASQTPDAWNADLLGMQNEIVTCIEAESAYVQSQLGKTLATDTSKISACLPASQSDWLGLQAAAVAIVKGGTHAPAFAPGGDAKAFDAAVQLYFTNEEAQFHAQTDKAVANKAASRSILATRLGDWSGGKPSDVVTFIRSLALLSPAEAPATPGKFSPAIDDNADLPKLDPVFAYAIAAAYLSANDTTATADIAASAALQRASLQYKTSSAATQAQPAS